MHGSIIKRSSILLIREIRERRFILALVVFKILGARLDASELRREVFRIFRTVQLRLVRGCERLGGDFLPVDAREPGVLHDLFGVRFRTAQTLRGVLLEQLGAQVFGLLGQKVVVQFGLCVLDVLVKLLPVLGVERGEAD